MSDEPNQTGHPFHHHRTKRLGAVAVALAQADHLHEFPPKPEGMKLLAKKTYVVEVYE